MSTPNTAGAPWGATADEWNHMATQLGLESDLLPVVSNPGATISEKSKMRDLGKTPSRYDTHRKVVGIPKWTQHVSTDRDVARWLRDSDLGICIQTRRVRALDIDIADPAAAQRVRDLVELGCGALPRRFRQATGKCLLAFDMPGDFAKRIIRTEHGLIEFLANGQQFIAIGTHTSGTRYEWCDADGVIGLPAEIPALTPAEFEVLWQALVDEFALPEGESRVRNGMVPTVARSRDDLKDPVVAWLDENGWVLEHERDGKVHVRCPWEDEHTSDSGPSATSWFPAGVGGFAMGHFRCLHAHCAARTDGDFLEEIGYSADDFEIIEAVADAKGTVQLALPPFARDRSGAPLATLNNVLMALRRPDVSGWRLGFDEFLDLLMIGPEGGTWRPFDDPDYTMLRSALEAKGFKSVSSELIKDSVRMIARDQRFDSAKQWAATLTWDGVPRVERFYSTYFGTEDTPYTRAVGRYSWSALAGRCVEPGVKADMAPVLIGLQGAGKTSAVEVLAPIPEAFVEINLEKKDEDIARSLRGKMVAEIAELRGLQSRDAEAIKAWASRRFEEWIPKYREFSTRFPRRCLLIGTGNRDGFLDDDTGERRWLPMHVGTVDVAGVERDRDQLWAEGLVLFASEGICWQDAYQLAKAEHHKFKVGDPWQEHIAEWLERDDMDGPRDTFRTIDVLLSALGFSVQKITRKDEIRVAKVLRMLGYEKGNKRIGGQVLKVWERAENSKVDERAENSAFSDLA